jgi:hypothetical protein
MAWTCPTNGRGERRSAGRKKRGRPKLTLTEGIRGLMGEKGLT